MKRIADERIKKAQVPKWVRISTCGSHLYQLDACVLKIFVIRICKICVIRS